MSRALNLSSSFDDDYAVDDVVRKNETAFKYTTIFHTTLCEKLYQELCALSFGEYDIVGVSDATVISPLMWSKLHEIYSELEMQTRKLPTGSKYSKSSQMYANEAVQIASVLAVYTSLCHEYDKTDEVSLLSKLIVDDVEFRKIYALLLWSEKAISEQQYEQGLAEKVRKLETTKSVRVASMMALKRPSFTSAAAPKDASLDPDAPGTKEDQALEQMALQTLFQLVRCGETNKAVNIAVDLGMGAVGAQLQLHAMLRNPTDLPLVPTKANFAEHKRARRAKYFEMTQKLIEESKGNENDAYWTLMSALRGNIDPMLKAGKTVIEKVWAYANSAFIARILAAEGSMDPERIAALFDVPLTAKSILEELRSEYDRTGEVLILLRVVDDMLNDDIEDLYRFGAETVGEYIPNDPTCEVNMLALDIFFHLVAVAYASGFAANDDGNAVIVLGFDDLRARNGAASHKRMAAFYSRFLPESMKVPEIVETMKLVDSSKERKVFANSLRQSKMDFGICACTLIQEVRKADEAGLVTLTSQIDHWDWLLVGGEETALAALEECNRLIRKVMLAVPMNELLVRQLIRSALRYDLPKNVSAAVENGSRILSLIEDGTMLEQDLDDPETTEKIEHAALEFYGICALADVHNFMITIALRLGIMFKYTPITEEELSMIGGVKRMDNLTSSDWEASLRLRARAETTLAEEMTKRKAADHNTRVGIVQQYLDAVLPMLRGLVNNIGLRPDYFLAPKSNRDPMKTHRFEIQLIRNLFLPQFFITLSQAAVKLDDMTTFHEFFASFHDDLGLDEQWIKFIKQFYAEVNLKPPQ